MAVVMAAAAGVVGVVGVVGGKYPKSVQALNQKP